MKQLTLIMDVDGVLANFYPGYNELCARMGKPILEPGRWDDFLDEEVWAAIKRSDDFWYDLPALVDERTFARIDGLDQVGTVYFVTNRPGGTAKNQTEAWLADFGLVDPTVIVTKFKGELAKAVVATHAIEDKAENAWCIAWLSPGTTSYLVDRPYNRYDPGQFGSSRVVRVATVEEWLDKVEADAHG